MRPSKVPEPESSPRSTGKALLLNLDSTRKKRPEAGACGSEQYAGRTIFPADSRPGISTGPEG